MHMYARPAARQPPPHGMPPHMAGGYPQQQGGQAGGYQQGGYDGRDQQGGDMKRARY